ncbi:hypothetical protein PARPLA_00855 [Rhodobacteraceae bacterium THAF1]|nr:hypothetical protein FIU81_12980 [Palleronia sp. THAF1]VDC17513.1 hypothetical protein PARPLA_00855 [Rhodobacteraceae bacterium THAF1]
MAWAPDAILGQIEARGIGILRVPTAPPTSVGLIVDLDMSEPERLPPMRTDSVDGINLPLVHARNHPAPANAVLVLLTGERLA